MVQELLKHMWRTRPVRLPSHQGSGAWAFGVAEGIGVRYQVSPNLIRLLFIALTFFSGLGSFVYILLLFVLPRYTVPLSPADVLFRGVKDRRFSRDTTIGWVDLSLGAGLLVLSAFTPGLLDIIGVVLVCAVAVLLHQRLPTPPGKFYATAFGTPEDFLRASEAGAEGSAEPGLAANASACSPTGSGVESNGASAGGRGFAGVGMEDTSVPFTKGVHSEEPATAATSEFFTSPYTAAEGFSTSTQRTPPSWDPLGAAPFAWDLPDPDEPDPEHKEKDKPKKPLVVRVLSATAAFIITVIVAALVTITAVVSTDIFTGSDKSNAVIAGVVTQSLDPNLAEQSVRFMMAEGDLDLTGLNAGTGVLASQGSLRAELNVTFASVALRIPRSTSGAGYRVVLNCAQTRLSTNPCAEGTGFDVPGGAQAPDGNKPLPTVEIVLRATAAEITVVRD